MTEENWKKCNKCGSQEGERYYNAELKIWLCRKCQWSKEKENGYRK